MATSATDCVVPVAETEAVGALMDRLGGKENKVSGELLVRHVMGVVPAYEWPVRVEALDAVLRRQESARKDELRLEGRPEAGRVLGVYATRRKSSNARP